MSSSQPLLKWRTTGFWFQSNVPVSKVAPYDLSNPDCLWCQQHLKIDETVRDGPAGGSGKLEAACPFCGWGYSRSSSWSRSVGWSGSSGSCHILVDFDHTHPDIQFDINDLKTPLDAVGTFLKTHYSDVYSLAPRRFEQLIEDVFKHAGFKTTLTQQTRDGGADIVLLRRDSSLAIVEVKRYAEDNTVGIGIVDRVLGAAIRWNARKAYLVTTSRFSKVAASIATGLHEVTDFELELWDTYRVLQELECYNDYYPPLQLLKPNHIPGEADGVA